ncbi:MAG: FCD domain-containing protein, partial [Acidimicrobiales bacterium]
LAFRSIVEVGAVGMVAERTLRSAERAELSAALAAAGEAPFEEYRQADGRLHLMLAELSGSALLTRAVAEVRLRVDDFLGALPTRDEPLVHSNAQHEQIVAAVLASDAAAARRAMTRHLEATASLLRGFLT